MTHTISKGSIQRWIHPFVQSFSPSPSRIINLQILLVRLLSRGFLSFPLSLLLSAHLGSRSDLLTGLPAAALPPKPIVHAEA